MKKLLVILFALGLVFSFTAPVMATDVSFDGTYRVRGFYDSNSALTKGDSAVKEKTPSAYYDQRFRLNTVFQVAEGLKVVVRFDALDGTWGTSDLRNPSVKTATTYNSVTYQYGTAVTSTSSSQSNLQFDKAYMSFVTGIGLFEAGYNSWGVWGTGFGDEEAFIGQVGYKVPVGDNLVFGLKTGKVTEGDSGSTYSDFDDDKYVAYGVYFNDTMQLGVLYGYYRFESYLSGMGTAYSTPYKDITAHAVNPYLKLTLGDLYIESEMTWIMDASANSTVAGTNDIELEALTFYLKGQYNMGPIYLGALFAYVQGDDPDTLSTDTIENALGILGSGPDWDPCLILFTDTCTTALGSNGSTLNSTQTTAMTGTQMDNGYLYQVFAGAAFDKLSFKATLTYAEAHEDYLSQTGPATYVKFLNKDYGTEFDVTVDYKLYDNLTYTVGAGYLWTGDYYKGTSNTNTIGDTYLLMNKLQVTF